jgi:hypothetical protein
MGPIFGTIETKFIHPMPKNPGVLPSSQVGRIVEPAGEKEVI